MKIDFEKVLADYGLKVGDVVKVTNEYYTIMFSKACGYYIESRYECQNIMMLVLNDFEKVEPKKKVGDMSCGYINCVQCPLHCLNCKELSMGTLNDITKELLEYFPHLEPMREWLEKELNKEIDE